MNSGKPSRGAVLYPNLKQLVQRSNRKLNDYSNALRRLLKVAYGERHLLLTTAQKKQRGTLQKLINLLDQLELMEEVNVFELSFRCPEQLNSYYECVQATIPLAREKGADLMTLTLARQAGDCLLEIHREVTYSADVLS